MTLILWYLLQIVFTHWVLNLAGLGWIFWTAAALFLIGFGLKGVIRE